MHVCDKGPKGSLKGNELSLSRASTHTTASKLHCQFVTVRTDQMLTCLDINDNHRVRPTNTQLARQKNGEKFQGLLDLLPQTPAWKAPEKSWEFTPLFGWKENNWVYTEMLHISMCLAVSECVCVYSCESVCV